MKNKKTFIVSALFGALAIIGCGGYLIAKEYQQAENNLQVKLEHKLIVGTYKESLLSNGKTCTNRLYVEIVNNGDVVEKINYETNHSALLTDGDYPDCVFIDLTANMSEYIDNLGIYFWSKSDPDRNYVSVRTECTGTNCISGRIRLMDSGIYLVNVPTATGEIPQVEHCYIYQQNIFQM